jgi:hypothetical protein
MSSFETIQAELDKIADDYRTKAEALAASLETQVEGIQVMLAESGLDGQTQVFLVNQFMAKIEAIGG